MDGGLWAREHLSKLAAKHRIDHVIDTGVLPVFRVLGSVRFFREDVIRVFPEAAVIECQPPIAVDATDDPYISIRDAARVLHVSTATLYKACGSKTIEHKRVNNAVKFRLSTLTGAHAVSTPNEQGTQRANPPLKL